ncbi:MAG TPA: response regulator [Candidatus Binatia bacterium]|nr:response regulator [Candidatus Binatia bacterium]
MRILVIDDQPAVAAVIADGLLEAGHQVMIAIGGLEGLEVLDKRRPDAVFLDLAMPDLDGVEVLRRIRARDPDLPVVVISGWGSEEAIASARALGVTEVLRKPEAVKNLASALSGFPRAR